MVHVPFEFHRKCLSTKWLPAYDEHFPCFSLNNYVAAIFETTSSGSSSAVTGAVVGSILGIALLLIVVYLLKRRKRKGAVSMTPVMETVELFEVNGE